MTLFRNVNGRRVPNSASEQAAIAADRAANREREFSVPRATGFIKAEARRRILARYPEWRQINMLTRGARLLEKQLTGGLSPAEQATKDDLETAQDWIASVRTAGDALETAMAAMDTDARAATNIHDDIHWPQAAPPPQ